MKTKTNGACATCDGNRKSIYCPLCANFYGKYQWKRDDGNVFTDTKQARESLKDVKFLNDNTIERPQPSDSLDSLEDVIDDQLCEYQYTQDVKTKVLAQAVRGWLKEKLLDCPYTYRMEKGYNLEDVRKVLGIDNKVA